LNFFEHQDRARASTRKLVLLFCGAVATLIVITTVLVVFMLSLAESPGEAGTLTPALFTSQIFVGVSALVISIVLLATWYRVAQLRGGGRAVAESLGGRLLNTCTRDADERKVLNIVEEMAIAAGLAVPQVYLLEDPAINAFAAGYQSQDAVIGVTRGCISLLSRDELQGVIAHEFSHIFNGDMRLNIRLIAWLYGIMVIGMIGYYLMRSNVYRHSSSSRGNNRGGIVVLGLGLLVIGYTGTFFGNLIKAAVSRQREFLADAAAVQYTRNPGGISGALKKIGGLAAGSRLSTVDVGEISHMLFGQGMAGLFATHPPLAQRIRQLEPGWNGQFPVVQEGSTVARTASVNTEPSTSPAATAGSAATEGFVARVGEPDANSLALAGRYLALLPAVLREEAHNPLGSCLVLQALLVNGAGDPVVAKQQAYLQEQLGESGYVSFLRVLQETKKLPTALRLPLVELTLPSLAQLSTPQRQRFLDQLQHLIDADAELSLFEWCLFRIVQSSLQAPQRFVGIRVDLQSVLAEGQCVLAALARVGHANTVQARAAFSSGVLALGLAENAVPAVLPDADLKVLDSALTRLQHLKPLQKPRLLKAMVECIQHDGHISSAEDELLRAVAAILDCPVPPLSEPLLQ
jgi:Zn-dependent protease with chaperone function/uncharacterized tellurite resistance protein B-like protein